MKKMIFVVAALAAFSVVNISHARTIRSSKAKVTSVAQVCKKVIEVTSGGLIYKQSAPLRSGGVGTPLVGYRKEPTLIMEGKSWARGTTTIYDSNGTGIGRCPWASAEHTRGGRWRCTMNTSSLRRTAIKNTKSPTIYFKMNSSTCTRVPDAGRCYGSVKGLCNQLIK